MTQPRDSKGRFMKKQPAKPFERVYDDLLEKVIANYEQVIANQARLIALLQEIINQRDAGQNK